MPTCAATAVRARRRIVIQTLRLRTSPMVEQKDLGEPSNVGKALVNLPMLAFGREGEESPPDSLRWRTTCARGRSVALFGVMMTETRRPRARGLNEGERERLEIAARLRYGIAGWTRGSIIKMLCDIGETIGTIREGAG